MRSSTVIVLLVFCVLNVVGYKGSNYPAPDFTKQDSEGNTHSLYDILDGGQHVAIKVTSVSG